MTPTKWHLNEARAIFFRTNPNFCMPVCQVRSDHLHTTILFALLRRSKNCCDSRRRNIILASDGLHFIVVEKTKIDWQVSNSLMTRKWFWKKTQMTTNNWPFLLNLIPKFGKIQWHVTRKTRNCPQINLFAANWCNTPFKDNRSFVRIACASNFPEWT